MNTLKTLKATAVKAFAGFNKANEEAVKYQREAGIALAEVKANATTFFLADDGTALTSAARGKAFATWYSALGMDKTFVSIACDRAELARLVPEVESTLNTAQVQRLVPVLKSGKGQKPLTDTQKVKAITSTLKKATAIAKKAGRSVPSGTDITTARNPKKREEDGVKVTSVTDVAELSVVLTDDDEANATALDAIANMLTALVNEHDERVRKAAELAA